MCICCNKLLALSTNLVTYTSVSFVFYLCFSKTCETNLLAILAFFGNKINESHKLEAKTSNDCNIGGVRSSVRNVASNRMEVVKKVFAVFLIGWLLLIDTSGVTGRAPVGFICFV